MQLHQQVHRTRLGVLPRLHVLLGLQRVEVVQLVQAQQRQVDEPAVVHLALFHQHLAPDDLVAGDGVAAELDARHVERLALVDVHVQVDQLLGLIHARLRRADHVDEAALAVGLAQRLQPLAEERPIKVVAVLDRELRTQRLGVRVELVAGKRNAAQPIALALFHRNQDVHALAGGGMQRERVDAPGVAHVGLRLARVGLEVALVLVGGPYALGVLVQLAGVKGPRKDLLQDDGVRYADRLQVLHRLHQLAMAQLVVAVKGDLAHLYGRAFLHMECQGHRRGRQRLDLGPDGCKLVSVFAQHLLQHHLGALHVSGVILALDGKLDLFLLIALQDV